MEYACVPTPTCGSFSLGRGSSGRSDPPSAPVPFRSRDIVIDSRCYADFEYWAREDRSIAIKILLLIADIRRDPFQGLGKPEPLKGELSGFWSRRITGEHRLVYEITDAQIRFVQARYHY